MLDTIFLLFFDWQFGDNHSKMNEKEMYNACKSALPMANRHFQHLVHALFMIFL